MAEPFATSGQEEYLPPVIGAGFCDPCSVDLDIYRTENGFIVVDLNRNNIVFKVEPLGERFLLTDADERAVATLQKKNPTLHDRWLVFKGRSNDPGNLLFNAGKPWVIQRGTKLDVFLGSSKAKDVRDFKVREALSPNSLEMSVGESSTIIAEIDTEKSRRSGKFKVKIHPMIDSAFVIAIIWILDRIKCFRLKLPFWKMSIAGNVIVEAIVENFDL